jgi:hypothetical protein
MTSGLKKANPSETPTDCRDQIDFRIVLEQVATSPCPEHLTDMAPVSIYGKSQHPSLWIKGAHPAAAKFPSPTRTAKSPTEAGRFAEGVWMNDVGTN